MGEFCNIEPMTSEVQQSCTVNREDLGTSLGCCGSENKNGGHFTRIRQEETGELLAESIARTARRQLEGRHLLFVVYLRC